ncbi:MAG: hypothetical protein LBQ54_03430 [Planctomycetaceae bacterium]|jgi:hypothetical protein|nr:hypothetical protein [Planctomycetaceae bacterium]
MKRFQILLMIGVSFVLFSCFGCGKSGLKTDAVTGTVTFNSKPVAGASVNFTPKGTNGHPAYAITEKDGTYKLQTLLGKPDAGTTPGDYIVTIYKTENEPTGRKIPDETNPDQMVEVMKAKDALPLIYKNPQKTPFSVTVVSGQANTFDFELTSK